MKIVVIGGTGLIGSRLVAKLRESGHDTVAAAPESGIDSYTGKGLEQAVEGARVVVDVSSPPVLDDTAVDFFHRSSRNILSVETTTGVSHHVVLSIVGIDRLPDSGYYRGKLAQEEAVRAASVPYTILRATQFFEFIEHIADSSTEGGTVRLPPVLVQPGAAEDVVAALAEVAVSEPLNGTVELAGPEPFRLDELARRVLDAKRDRRQVTSDANARYFGTELDYRSLIPGANPRLAPTRFEDWLTNSTAGS